MMDIEATEAAYADLRRAFEYGQMNALSYQAAIDELCVQDNHGRYWMIGAETGEWYYHDGREWIQADPRDGRSLPFVDEHGVYWVLGQNQHDWYYYDGSEWILHDEAEQSVTEDQTDVYALNQTDFRQTDTQYYQDDEGRYWAIGAKSGKWYYYDQDGWHLAEDDRQFDQAHDALEVPQQFDNNHYSQPSQTDYQGQSAYFASQSVATGLNPTPSEPPTSTASSPYHTQPTQPIPPQPQSPMANPSPSVQAPQPTYDASVSSQAPHGPPQGLSTNGMPVHYAQPHDLASPAQPVYNPYNTQPIYPDQFSPTGYSQVYTTQPYPQSIPVQSPSPTHINPEPDTTGVWYYYPDEGSWCYYDGEKWIVYYDDPKDNDAAQARLEDDHLQDDLPVDRAYSPDDFAVEIDDGTEQATGFDDNFKETEAKQAVLDEGYLDEAYLDEDETDIEEVESDISKEDDNIIEIEDLDDFIEVIEVVDEDIEQEDDLVEAEFEVSVYKPSQEPVDPPPSINSTVDTATVPPFGAFDNRATAPSTIGIPPTPPPTSPEGQTTPPPPPQTTRAMPVPPANLTVGMRPNIDTTTQFSSGPSPLPRTEARSQTNAMPKAVTQPQEGQLSDLLLTFPMWLWTSLAGGSTLILTAVIIIFTLYVLNNFNQSDTFARIQPTQTLPAVFSGAAVVFEATPTTVVPSLPASDRFSLSIYSNKSLGFSLSHAPDWVYREYENTVIFASNTESLDPNNLQGSALWISLSHDTSSDQRLAEVLANFEPITDRLAEGTMSIANHAWPSAQIRFQSATLGTEAVALVASTGMPSRSYTLVAAAPIHEWENFKPLVEISIQSFKFIDLLAEETGTEQHFSQTPSNSAENSVSIAGEGISGESLSSGEERSRAALNAALAEPPTATPIPNTSTPKPTATPTPTFTPSAPRIHTVASGDSLGKIAARYNVSIDDIVLANKMDQSDYLQIGQELYVPRPGDSAEEIAALITDTPTPTPTDTPSGPLVHTVTSGDTLGGLSVQYDVSVAEIVAANRLSNKNVILRLGQELIIPLPGLPTEQSTFTSTAEIARQRSSSRPVPTSSLIRSTATATPVPTDTPVPTEVVVEEPTDTPEVEEEATPEPTETPTPEPAAVLSGLILYPAYSSEINSFNIWRSNLDGTEQEMVIFNASQPNVNRSGTLLTYRSWDTSNRGIFYQSVNGGPPERLTGFVEDALPTWAPNESIVFTSRREGDRVPRLFRVYQEGGDGEGLGFNADNLDVMPNGNFIARGCTVSGDCGLWLVSGLGQGQAKISGNTSDTAPAVRPQGGRIAIMSFDRGGSNNWEIWLINEDGSEPLRLTENVANDGLPAWSPDGQSIAFVSDRGGVWAVWVMNVDGSNQRKLFNMKGSPTGQVLHDTENSRGWLEERIAWQP